MTPLRLGDLTRLVLRTDRHDDTTGEAVCQDRRRARGRDGRFPALSTGPGPPDS
ncbi:hypothetical protein [Streptomyces sp. NPDC049881]|uniref:hypothetical protein n=1 Tax=Streptomyces sp. NPDC049881 TaxID=3155778 RepID=UPI003442A271